MLWSCTIHLHAPYLLVTMVTNAKFEAIKILQSLSVCGVFASGIFRCPSSILVEPHWSGSNVQTYQWGWSMPRQSS